MKTQTNAPKARYDTMRTALENLLNDLQILAGEKMGPSDATWQDVAGTAAVNAQVMANQLNAACHGNAESFITFPSPAEALESTDAAS